MQTSDDYEHYKAQWSPDGNWIAYYKGDATGHYQIYRISSAGGTEVPLTSDSYIHYYPQWSPDGNWIVYEKLDATGYFQIYKISSGTGIEETETGNNQTGFISAYPNPFRKKTDIVFSLGHSAEGIELKIYDVTGSIVKNYPHFTPDAIRNTLSWDGTDDNGRKVATGVYLIRLKAGDSSQMNKIILCK